MEKYNLQQQGLSSDEDKEGLIEEFDEEKQSEISTFLVY